MNRNKLVSSLAIVAGSLLGFIIGNSITPQSEHIKHSPRVVISLCSHGNLLFTCVSTNDHIFYLSDMTNGVYLKVDYVWGSGSDSNAIQQMRSKQ